MGLNPTVRGYERRAFTTLFGRRIRLIRCFQEAMSEIMMGRFIAHEGRTEWVKMRLEENVRHVINAYIYFLSLPCILSFFGKEIRESRTLDDYFMQFKVYPRWREAYDSGTLPQPTILDWFTFFRELGYTIGYTYFLYKIGELIKYPILAQQYIYEMFPESVWKDYVNPFFVVNWVNQNLNRDDFDLGLTQIPSYLWYPIHPFVHLDWTVIKSYIQLYYAYAESRLKDEYDLLIPPYIKHMPVKIDTDIKHIGYSHIGEDGEITVKIPKKDVFEKIALDTFGLRLEIPIGIAVYDTEKEEVVKRTLRIYVQNTSTWIAMNETEWVKTEPTEDGFIKYMFEDQKNQPSPDFDYDDAIIYVKVYQRWIELKISHCLHDYTNEVWLDNLKVYTLKPKDTPEEKLEYHAIIDGLTLEIAEVKYP